MYLFCFFFFFKQKTAYEMRISDWSSDVCSSDLQLQLGRVFDGDDPLVMRNEAGQHVEHGGLAAAGTTGNQHVQPPTDDGLEHQCDGRRQEIGRASCRERVCQYV